MTNQSDCKFQHVKRSTKLLLPIYCSLLQRKAVYVTVTYKLAYNVSDRNLENKFVQFPRENRSHLTIKALSPKHSTTNV